MRNIWKIAVAFTLVLGFGGALAQAQLITGNTAAFGCGPISTSDFASGAITHQFYPDGAGGSNCPDNPINHHNGRGLAVGGTEVFYTELDEVNPGVPAPGFGGSEFIHVANFNAGVGSGDTRLLANPRSGSGIQDLTFANSILYVLTGYDTQVPIVYGLNLLTGAVVKPGVTIERVGDVDDSVDGFAVLPNGNFLMNNKATSCIYSEYSSADGHFIGNTIQVVPPACDSCGPAQCTGVDTDGTSLYFMTDFTGIVRTDLLGNKNGYNSFDGPGGENFIEDISLVHPVTTITDVGHAHLFFTIKNNDDINTAFDIRTELFKCQPNVIPCDTSTATLLGTGLKRCIPTTGAGAIVRNLPGSNIDVPFSPATLSESLVPGDVLAFRVSTRIGTNTDDTKCALSVHSNAVGLRLYYDSAPGDPSQFPLTISPNPSQSYYLHSDGGTCTNTNFLTDSVGVTTRFLSTVAPVATIPRCKDVGTLDFNKPTPGANPFVIFSTWTLPPQP
jgi:hypothetical protein